VAVRRESPHVEYPNGIVLLDALTGERRGFRGELLQMCAGRAMPTAIRIGLFATGSCPGRS